MVDYKEILRLSSIGYSLRQTVTSTGHSHHTVKQVLELAENMVSNGRLMRMSLIQNSKGFSFPKEKLWAIIMPNLTTTTSTRSFPRKA